MAKKVLILIIVFLGLYAIGLAQAAVSNRLYLPVVVKERTPTPTPTPTPIPSMYLSEVVYNPPNNYMNEYVTVLNITGRSVFMEGWSLHDDSKNTYTFPYYILRTGGTVKVWTKSGNDSYTDLYWGLSEPVWNDHGDCAYLRNPAGEKIVQRCFP